MLIGQSTPVKTRYLLTICDHIVVSGLELIKVKCFFLNGLPPRYCFFIGSQAQALLSYCNRELRF